MSKANLIQIDNPPEGWSADPDELAYDEQWAKDDSVGQKYCQDWGVGKGRPVLCNDEFAELIFEAEGKFYMWYQIGDSVSKIVSPADLDGILDVLRSKGPKGLKMSNRI
ncbi:hypothetical protein FQN54_004916 [Arachnomyces sp. PD_36]|nr:hypothetical protein FQN54_004916 [Arachnomyces sp. PD_36]